MEPPRLVHPASNSKPSDENQQVVRTSLIVLPEEVRGKPLGFSAYQRAAGQTDRLASTSLNTPILGLFGETGSLLSVLKKKHRDAAAYTAYDEALLEELGDVLWYLSTIATRVGLDLSVLAQRVSRGVGDWDEVKHGSGSFGDIQGASTPPSDDDLADSMMQLAARVGELVNDFQAKKLSKNRDAISAHLVDIFGALIRVAECGNVLLADAATGNLQKIFSRWPIEERYPEPLDVGLPQNERLPRRFRMFIEEHNINGKIYVLQKRNGVIIGDRLTDNKAESDDYRFHDVFHFAYAVHLGWSPVLRSLFRLKRKSLPKIDENEDGARAVLIEEGIATFIFGRALGARELFAGIKHLDYDLLKTVSEFVRGFEAERCALWQWERAILDGFKVFRDLKRCRRGYVQADLEAHTLTFEEGIDCDEGTS